MELNRAKIIMFVILFSLAFFTRINVIELPLGITITFVSIFLLLILRLYNLRTALLSALLIHLISVFNFQFILWDIGMFLELVFISLVFRYKPKSNIVIWGALFWVFIGVISSAWVYYFAFDLKYESVLIFSAAKDILNGVFNILVFDILLTYLPFHKWMRQRSPKTIDIKQLLFHLSCASMILPFLLYATFNLWNSIETVEKNLIQSAEQNVKQVEQELKSWNTEDILSLKLFGVIQIGYLEQFLATTTLQEELIVTTTDGIIIATNNDMYQPKDYFDWMIENKVQQVNPHFYQVIPDDDTIPVHKWANGYYLYETFIDSPELKLLVKQPIKPHQEKIFSEFVDQFMFLTIFVLFALVFSISLHRLLAKTLNRLAKTTNGLARKLKTFEPVQWPASRITEIASLIENFKAMSVGLQNMLKESNKLNEKLREQAEELKRSENMLHKLAFYDSLTSLPNRQYFQQYLPTTIQEAKYKKFNVAVLFMDLNQFKQINDTLGHSAGDELLKFIANKLVELETSKVQAFRLSGDEFVIIVKEVANKHEVLKIAKAIEEIFEKQILIQEQLLHVSGSVGISMYPADGEDEHTLVQNADIAMYSSKAKPGTTVEFYNEEMRVDFTDKIKITNELKKAIKRGEFQLHYQPKVSKSKQLKSVEALIRWKNKDMGDVSPALFIPLAEECGLIHKIDQWVLYHACKQNKEWQNAGYPKIKVSVNVSVKNFHQSQLVEKLKETLVETKLEAKYLQIELTESVFIENSETVIEMIHQIRQLGVSVSIDDFGKGFSSLSHLMNLPISEIKLDRQFITNVNADHKKALIASHIVEMAHQLNFNVVAEGVETSEELEFLKQIECDELQGFLFSKPVPKEIFEQFLKAPQF